MFKKNVLKVLKMFHSVENRIIIFEKYMVSSLFISINYLIITENYVFNKTLKN